MTRYLPIAVASAGFRLLAPLALRLHARPMERLRTHFGLASLGYDLRRCYTDADLRLFANFSELYPEIQPGPAADFLGPVAWSPEKGGWEEADLADDPPIYVTMGSSGDVGVLARLIPVLESTGRPVLLATAGRPVPAAARTGRVRLVDFLPGERVCRSACLVVCNGGSPSTNQALAAGVPVLGIARNMDQFLNMRAIEAYGAGLSLRADRAGSEALRRAVDRLLHEPGYRARARRLAASAAGRNPGAWLGAKLAGLIERG
jgi:UDP:flavonoid glycosyltransferase YjiC (YdhE family)